MDHFWIILGQFSAILLTVLSTLCQWSCGLVHHFLEAKLLEQVNLHFWIIYNTLLVQYVALYLHYVTLMFGIYVFGSFL